MRLVRTVGLAVGFAVAAASPFVRPVMAQQGPSMAIPLNQDEAKSPEEIEKQQKIESDYKATIKKIPDAKANDPWGNMRSADTATSAKPAQIKPKTTAAKKPTAIKKSTSDTD